MIVTDTLRDVLDNVIQTLLVVVIQASVVVMDIVQVVQTVGVIHLVHVQEQYVVVMDTMLVLVDVIVMLLVIAMVQYVVVMDIGTQSAFVTGANVLVILMLVNVENKI